MALLAVIREVEVVAEKEGKYDDDVLDAAGEAVDVDVGGVFDDATGDG